MAIRHPQCDHNFSQPARRTALAILAETICLSSRSGLQPGLRMSIVAILTLIPAVGDRQARSIVQRLIEEA